ncbi:MAG TPA: ATP-binding protein [Mucilaginibacter sp.]|nr:ATP-binding protein [Mucilaginibacter sp.]
MKTLYGFLILFVLSLPVVKAQDKWPPVYEIKSDTAAQQDIDDKYWQLLEDPGGKLTINQVSSPAYNDKFHSNTTRANGCDYAIDTYWLRYRFRNTLSHTVKLTIPEHVAYAWLYLPAGKNKWRTETTGELVPWSMRNGLKKITQFVVAIDTGQEVDIYERDVFDFRIYKPKFFQFTIGFADAAIKKGYVDTDSDSYTVGGSVIFGFLLLAFLVNLLFYNTVRERVYLYFSLFLLFLGLYYFISVANIAVFAEYPYLAHYLYAWVLAGEFFMLMHFVRHFLSVKTRFPRWDKFLVVLSYVIIIAWLTIYYLPPSLSYNTFLIINLSCNLVVYTYMPFILVTALMRIRGSQGQVRLGIYALLPQLLWWSVVYTSGFTFSTLHYLFQIPIPHIVQWTLVWSTLAEFLFFAWLVIIFSWILFKRFRDTQQRLAQLSFEKEMERARLIEEQKIELEQQVEARTAELKKSLTDLKATQAQLIQSEKMASLGELTAGIAHEIQNPLNFVNNFAEVNTEMLEELKAESLKPKAERDEQLEIELINDLIDNEQKITHHGKRADAIVKGMLQHSRAGSDVKEPTDISKLADEYLRLSYHGLRAKDKSFNAEMVTHFDEDLPKVNIVPQDIGRVLLNLFNNAFYAVHQKAKTAEPDYKPTVTVTTAPLPPEGGVTRGIIISVRDNGPGIPDAIKEKIMQPFFTTKPTGEGTGLGLSLSYEIVVKGHGGKIEINSREGEYTEFVVSLPIS